MVPVPLTMARFRSSTPFEERGWNDHVVGGNCPSSKIIAADVSVDASHEITLGALDLAGNPSSASWSFRVVRLQESGFQIAVPAVEAVVPDALMCALACQVTFKDVQAAVGERTVTISSTAHAGAGSFVRRASLAGAEVEWVLEDGGTTRTSIALPAIDVSDEITLDDAFSTETAFHFDDVTLAIGDMTATPPPGVAPGSTARLAMPMVTVASPCADSSVVADPSVCGGPLTSEQDPLSPEVVVPAFDEAAAIEALGDLGDIATDVMAAASPEEVLPEVPGQPELPPLDLTLTEFVPGIVQFQVAQGASAQAVLTDHGIALASLGQDPSGPFTPDDVEMGVDRFYYIEVTPGTEKTSAAALDGDPRLTYVSLAGSAGGPMGAWEGDGSKAKDQWNLFGNNGIHVKSVWEKYSHGESFGARDIQTAILDQGSNNDHEDLQPKADRGYRYTPRAPGYTDAGIDNYNSLDKCSHGSRVAGIDAMTNNGKGLAGVNYSGHFIPINIASGDDCKLSTPNRGAPIYRAIAMGAEVINISFAWKDYDPQECAAVLAAYRAGVTMVVTGPNNGQTTARAGDWDDNKLPYPARCSEKVTGLPGRYPLVVGATDESGELYTAPNFSNPPYVRDLDIAAPGANLRSICFGVDNGYVGKGSGQCVTSSETSKTVSGASYATPHVSGVAQLLHAMGVPPNTIPNALAMTATRIPDECPAPCTGRLNAYRAVKSALYNGIFEQWPNGDTDTLPTGWYRKDRCGGNDDVARGTLNTSRGSGADANPARYSLKMRCASSGNLIVNKLREVSAGWNYRAQVRVRTEEGQVPDALVRVCWLDAERHLLQRSNGGPKCESRWAPSEAEGAWASIALDTKGAPAEARFALYQLVVGSGHGSGWTSFDDAAFFGLVGGQRDAWTTS